MNKETLTDLCKVLKETGVKYVLVGGASLEMHDYEIGTLDIDFIVTIKDFQKVIKKLKKNPRFRNVEDLKTMASSEFLMGTTWIDVEFINPKLFCGSKNPDYFVDYVINYRSVRTPIGHVAKPEVVWYMRLIIPDWEIYVQKIMRDVRAGLPSTLLDEVEEIAKVFNVKDILKSRVQKAKEYLAMK